jgi:hypothetical protein
MIGFNHALAGVIIGVTVPAPFVPVVALASHFAMDALPHFGRSETFKPYTGAFKALLVIDGVICLAVLAGGLWLFPSHAIGILLGTFFARLPDFLWLLEGRVQWMKRYFHLAHVIQWGEVSWGWMLELVYAAIFFTIIVVLA